MTRTKGYSEEDELNKHSRLDLVEAKWSKKAIDLQFWEVHHFSNKEKFSGKKEKLHVFVEWCRQRTIQAENNQTLDRAVEVVRQMEAGIESKEALTPAWRRYPIVTR